MRWGGAVTVDEGVRIDTGQVDTGCGTATSAVGPFNCPVDSTADDAADLG